MANATYKKILVAIDLAEHSTAVLSKAKQFAEKNDGAELHAIHIIHVSPPSFPGCYSETIQETIYDNCQSQFSKLCESYGIKSANRHIAVGSPKSQILTFADKIMADLIVLGSYGEQHLLPATFGSTATSILTKAQCDVLTVSILEFLKARQEKKELSESQPV